MEKHEICPARDLTAKSIKQIIKGYNDGTVKSSHFDEGIKLICHCAAFRPLQPNNGAHLLRRRRLLTKDEVIFQGCWVPKEHPELSQGRFNEKGQSMAYFCDTGSTADMEVFGKSGEDHHSLVAKIRKSGLKVAAIFPVGSPCKFSENIYYGTTEEVLDQFEKEYPPELFEMVCLATTFLGDAVSTLRTADNDIYRITNSIAKGVFAIWKVDGILYASTKAALSGNNVALKPSAADEYIAQSELIGVQYLGSGNVPCITEAITYRQDWS